MKTTLNIPERIIILELLPKEGNFITLRTLHKTKMKLSLTKEEVDKYDIKFENDRITWNAQLAEEQKDFIIDDVIKALLQLKLKELDDKQKLEPKHLSIYEKIFEVQENETSAS